MTIAPRPTARHNRERNTESDALPGGARPGGRFCFHPSQRGGKAGAMKSTCKMTKALLGLGVILLLVFTFVGHVAAQTWIQLFPTAGPPDVRSAPTAVYSQAANRIIVFGGAKAGLFVFVPPSIALLNDVWVLSNADGTEPSAPAWTQLNPTSSPPSKRLGSTSVYDPNSNRMILFGGNPNNGFCFLTINDLWVLSNADGTEPSTPAWTQLSTTDGPSQRWLHTAGYDPAMNRMIVFGGADACRPLNNEVWVLENANGLAGTPTWTQLSPTGTPPPTDAPVSQEGVYDPSTNRLIVVSSTGSGTGLNDVRVLTNANGSGGTPTWIQLNPTGGPPTTGSLLPSFVYDPTSNRLIVFGGQDPAVLGGRINEVWVLSNANGTEPSTPAWTQLSPTAGPPLGRDFHSAIYNPATNRMTAFGGVACLTSPTGGPCTALAEFSPLNDVWVLTDANGIVDSDGDGIPDDVDLCPDENPGELDLNGDGCTDSLGDVGDELQDTATEEFNDAIDNILSDPSIPDSAADEVQDALDNVIGNKDGKANNGAADKFQDGDLMAGLTQTRKAILNLQDAAAQGADTTALQALLMDFARVAVLGAIQEAAASGDVTTAQILFDDGDSLLDTDDFLGALDLYKDAVQALP